MIQSLESKNDRHNLKLYSDKDLIKLCKHYQYSKDIPRWLYCAIRHRKIQDIAMRHITSLNPKRTFDEVQKEASKYKYRSDFQIKSNWAYQWAYKHGVLDEVCSKMQHKGNLKKRCVYVATFDDGYAYVGLTWNTADRWQRHMNKRAEKPSPIYLHSVASNLQPNFVQLTDYVPEVEAKIEEKRYIKEYSQNWIMLNSSKGGELGTCSYKWTKKAIFECVNVCSSYLEFREKFPGAYAFALKRKWNKEIELILPKERTTWSEEHIRTCFGECKTIHEVYKKCPSAINAAKAMRIYEELCLNLTRGVSKPYTEQEIRDFVNTLKYQQEFAERNRAMMNAAIRLGIYEELKNSLLPNPPKGKSLEEYIKLASDYDTRGQFKKAHAGAYAIIISKEGWAEKCFAHMKYACRPKRTNQEILESASKHPSIIAWRQSDPGAYHAARKRGLFAEATKHMRRPANHKRISDAFCIEMSKNYDVIKDFKTEHPNVYAAICKRGKEFQILCLGHMERKRHSYTKEQALDIAKCYNGRTALFKGNNSVYNYLRNHLLLDIAFPQNKKSPIVQ